MKYILFLVNLSLSLYLWPSSAVTNLSYLSYSQSSDSYYNNTNSVFKYESNYEDIYNNVYFEKAHFHKSYYGLFISSKICIKNIEYEKKITLVEVEMGSGVYYERRRSPIRWDSTVPPFADNHQVVNTNYIYDCFTLITATEDNRKAIFYAEVQMGTQIYFSGRMTVERQYQSKVSNKVTNNVLK